MDFPHLTYEGPAIDDPELLARLPDSLAAELRRHNGLIAWNGGFHLRGACALPAWHSLRAAWDGPMALHALYPAVRTSDVPFAEEACGDQFLLRDQAVLRLNGETGQLSETSLDLKGFLAAVRDHGIEVLSLQPLLEFLREGRTMAPGQLLSVYPPFCVDESAHGVSLRAIPAEERRAALADLARQIRELPDGQRITLRVV